MVENEGVFQEVKDRKVAELPDAIETAKRKGSFTKHKTTLQMFYFIILYSNFSVNTRCFDDILRLKFIKKENMDIITKYFGPKASNKIALLAASINVLTCLIFYIVSII